MKVTTKTRHGILVGGLFMLAGCAGTPPPEAELTAADLSVREAEEADAQQFAPVPLQEAREKLARARQAVEDEEMVAARRFAEQAAADAQLAEAEARAEMARSSLREVQQGVQQLRERALDAPAGTGG